LSSSPEKMKFTGEWVKYHSHTSIGSKEFSSIYDAAADTRFCTFVSSGRLVFSHQYSLPLPTEWCKEATKVMRNFLPHAKVFFFFFCSERSIFVKCLLKVLFSTNGNIVITLDYVKLHARCDNYTLLAQQIK
jgi:hypothetical protein